MKNLKKFVTAALVSAILLLPAAAYADGIRVILNGAEVSCDIAPVLDEGRLYIQARPVLERLGFSVGWDSDEKKLTACTSTDMFEATAGSNTVMANGKEYTFDTMPVIIMNRLFVTEEFLQRMLGLETDWDPGAMTETLATFDYDAGSGTAEDNREQPGETAKPQSAPKDFDTLYSRFREISTREEQSKAFDIMMEVDMDTLKSMSNDTEAMRAYLEETLSPDLYRDAMELYEKYKDAV